MYGMDPMGGGAPPMGAPAMDPLGGAPPPEEAPADDEDPWDMVLQAVRSAAEADGHVTPKENVLVEKITSLIAQLQADRYKEDQAALGGSPALNSLRRNSG